MKKIAILIFASLLPCATYTMTDKTLKKVDQLEKSIRILENNPIAKNNFFNKNSQQKNKLKKISILDKKLELVTNETILLLGDINTITKHLEKRRLQHPDELKYFNLKYKEHREALENLFEINKKLKIIKKNITKNKIQGCIIL